MSRAIWAGLADVATADEADRLAAGVDGAGGIAVASGRLEVLAAFADRRAAAAWLERVLADAPGLRAALTEAGDDPDAAEAELVALIETARPGTPALSPAIAAAATGSARAEAEGATRLAPSAPPPAPPPEPSDPGADLRPGHMLSHTYEITELIARGGMGSVYLARHADLGSQHAIKVISPEHARDPHVAGLFRREAESLRSIRHEAVIGHEGVIRDEAGRLYLVMEYADGPSLADVLQDGPLDPGAVEVLASRVGAGLEAAHEKGIIHRDISPDNIVLVGGDVARALIIDFGIARNLETARRTLIGSQFAGKYSYASPEQLGLFGGHVDRRSDLYSLGLVLAAALGRPIDLGRSPADAARNRERAVDVSGFPAPWAGRLARLLAPDPQDRPTRYRDLIAQETEAPRAAAGRSASGPGGRGGGGRGLGRIAAGLVLLAAIGGGLWAMRDSLTGGDAPAPAAQTEGTGADDVAQLSEPRDSGAGATGADPDPPATEPRPTEEPPATEPRPTEEPEEPPATEPRPTEEPDEPSDAQQALTEAPEEPRPERPGGEDAGPASGPVDDGDTDIPGRDMTAPDDETGQPSDDTEAEPDPRPRPETPDPPDPPITVEPDPAPLPSRAELRGAARAALDALPAAAGCHRFELGLDRLEGGYRATLSGVVPDARSARDARAALAGLNAVSSVAERLTVRPAPFCGFLALAGPDRRAQAPLIVLNHADAAYRDGERISLRLTARGDGPRHLHVAYVDRNGDLAHLLPNPVIPDNRLAPGGSIALGEPRAEGGHRNYAAAEPHGDNLVIAVSASAPLFDDLRREVEHADTYLPALQAAIRRVEAAGGRVSIAHRFLETQP